MKILYASDGSEGALSAGRFLSALEHRSDVHVHILTVRDPDDEFFDAHAVCEQARLTLGAFPAHVTTASAPGQGTSGVVEQILLTAEALPADLIVVGTYGHSALRRFLAGSVTESVARYAPCPVLLVRPLADGALDKVLIGMDGSDRATDAARWAMQHLPMPAGSEVHLLSVVVPPTPFGIGTGTPVPYLTERIDEALERAYEHANAALALLATEFQEKYSEKGLRIVTETRGGHPSSTIEERARAEKVDLVVVGSHGLSGIERFLLGSVSEAVLRHAPSSVLIVKTGPAPETTPVLVGAPTLNPTG